MTEKFSANVTSSYTENSQRTVYMEHTSFRDDKYFRTSSLVQPASSNLNLQFASSSLLTVTSCKLVGQARRLESLRLQVTQQLDAI